MDRSTMVDLITLKLASLNDESIVRMLRLALYLAEKDRRSED